jgi:hypothetical protein
MGHADASTTEIWAPYAPDPTGGAASRAGRSATPSAPRRSAADAVARKWQRTGPAASPRWSLFGSPRAVSTSGNRRHK